MSEKAKKNEAKDLIIKSSLKLKKGSLFKVRSIKALYQESSCRSLFIIKKRSIDKISMHSTGRFVFAYILQLNFYISDMAPTHSPT